VTPENPTEIQSVGILRHQTPAIIAVSDTPAPQPESDPAAVRAELIEEHNRARAEADLGPLTSNPKLQAAAQAHAEDMAATGKMSHTGSNGSSIKDRVEATGYSYQTIGENVAEGQRTPQEAIEAWMKSPGHRKNVLGNYSEIGVAYAADQDGRIYWCADFGQPWSKLTPAEAADRLIDAINAARAKIERRRLKVSPALSTVAQAEARLMAEQETLKPKSPDRKTVFDRIDATRAKFGMISGSGASGLSTPDEVLKYWMDDSDTKATILGDFFLTGAGYATAKNGMPYWYVLFAQPARR
jgi:uncharacterized protein YkwD